MSQPTNHFTAAGLIILLAFCIIPMVVGGFMGWWIRSRVDRYGIRGAFIPDFIHEWMGPK